MLTYDTYEDIAALGVPDPVLLEVRSLCSLPKKVHLLTLAFSVSNYFRNQTAPLSPNLRKQLHRPEQHSKLPNKQVVMRVHNYKSWKQLN